MKRFGLNSLAMNITGVALLASAISLALTLAVLFFIDRRDSLRRYDMEIEILANAVGQNATASLSFDDRTAAAETLQALRSDTTIVTGCIYNMAGMLFASYQRDGKPMGTVCPVQLSEQLNGNDQLRTIVRPILRQQDQVGTIQLRGDLSFINKRQQKMASIALVILLMALLASIVAGMLLQMRVTRPIAELANALLQVTRGSSFNFRVKAAGSTEIRKLAIGMNSMLAELERRSNKTREAEAMLMEQANTDALTGLPNRRYFSDHLRISLTKNRQQNSQLALLYLDLDGFKIVNDSLGHNIGDMLLRSVVHRLRKHVRNSDTLARLGGDEFAVILNEVSDASAAEQEARILLSSFGDPFRILGHEIVIAASVGISMAARNMDDGGGELLQQADSAMYAAKQRGRNCIVLFTSDMGMMARERLNLESQMRAALTRKEFYLDYQPEFELKSGRLVRFEALARWTHPHLGKVPPDKFIKIAEESGLIHSLGIFLLEMACKEAVRWLSFAVEPVQVAVNFSAIQFNSASIVEEIFDVLRRTGLRHELLQVELTETTMIDSIQRSAEKMMRLQAAGISVVIDDFGTGYSSLSYLPELPVDAIKVDRSFVRNLRPGSDAVAMLQTIVDLAHSMKLSTIIEGVENQVQLDLAKGVGADEVQGFLLGRPQSDAESVIRRFQGEFKQDNDIRPITNIMDTKGAA